MSNNTLVLLKEQLPHSKIDHDFFEKKILKRALEKSTPRFTLLDFEKSLELQTFFEIQNFMENLIERKFLSASSPIHFVLGPISPRNTRTVEENLLHFLRAFYHHTNEGRPVFPQFLFSPIISNIAETRKQQGESEKLVYDKIMTVIYEPLFSFLKEKRAFVCGH